MIEGMVADEMALRRHAPREVGKRLDPSALKEDRGPHLEAAELVEHPAGVLAVVRPIRVLGVEGEGDAGCVAHFSTPVMTMPRMNARCAKKKMTTGITIVMSVAAWMYCGSEP